MKFLQVQQLVKRIKGAGVVSAVSFQQQQGERIAIAGETGSGKSTLLRMIAALEQPDEGAIYFKDEKIKGPLEKLLPGHPAIAYLSQHFELPHYLKVVQALEYASLLTEEETARICRLCGISHLLRRRTDELSGGEAQRMALARLLVTKPQLLLLDEPYSNLDPAHKSILKQVIRDLEKNLSLTCILVSHDPQDTLAWADTILVMKDGHIVQADKPARLYEYPVNEYAAGLFGRYCRPDKALRDQLGIPAEEGRSFFRPGDFMLSTTGDGVMAEIKHSRYMGTHTELELEVAGQTIWLHTAKNRGGKGDKIGISYRK